MKKNKFNELELIRKKLRFLFQKRDFSDKTRKLALISKKSIFKHINNDESFNKLSFLKAVNQTIEVLDYCSLFTSDNSFYDKLQQQASIVFREVKKENPSKISEKKLFREKVRFVLLAQANENYRMMDYRQCQDQIEILIQVIKNEINPEINFHCSATLGQLLFFLGKVVRQRGQYRQAEEFFNQSIHFFMEKNSRLISENILTENKTREISDYFLIAEELQNRIAVVEVAKSWLYFNQGSYNSALNAANFAKKILKDKNDYINNSYIKVIISGIKKVQARDEAEMNEAILSLEQARQDIEGSGFLKHRSLLRVIWELADAHLVSNDLFNTDKQKLIDSVGDLIKVLKSSSIQSPRWTSQLLILQSRLKRKEAEWTETQDWSFVKSKKLYKEAVDFAKEAFFSVADTDDKLSIIQSRIALAASFLDTENFTFAKNELTKALEINNELQLDKVERIKKLSESNNLEVEAICCLYLARIAIRQADAIEAQNYLERYKGCGQLENHWINSLASFVKAEVQGFNESSIQVEIQFKGENIDFDKTQEIFRINMYKYAKQLVEKGGTKTKKVETFLNRSSKSIKRWEKDYLTHKEKK